MRLFRCLAVAVSILLLAGCVPSHPTPTPSPTATPVFASDEDALEAATAAYAKYVSVSSSVLANGGQPLDDLADVATESHIAELAESFKEIAAKGYRVTGVPTFDTVSLQSLEQRTDASVRITLYLCSDISSTSLVDSAGNAVGEQERQERLPLEVLLASSGSSPSTLLVDGSSLWDGDDFCQ